MNAYKVTLRAGEGLKHRSGAKSNLGSVEVSASSRREAIGKAAKTLKTDCYPHHYSVEKIGATK